MPVRNIYLKIETIPDYSPVSPDKEVAPPVAYERDCMRNPGHEDTKIPPDEVNARRLTALVYREYLDPGFVVPKPDKLIVTDINEPAFDQRVPGTVIYAWPGDRLCIHVKNADTERHSFHVHGLRSGIDSDGAWPFGTQSTDGRRSDEICPGQTWTYMFDVTDEMIGAWPFHDHYRDIEPSVNRGLFGGIIVRPAEERDQLPQFPLPEGLVDLLNGELGPVQPGDVAVLRKVDTIPDAAVPFLAVIDEMVRAPQVQPFPKPPEPLHVPLFYHRMSGRRDTPIFQSGPLRPRILFLPGGTFTSPVFSFPAVYHYFCGIHGPSMAGTIDVAATGPTVVNVSIVDNQYIPATATVGVGGKVIWTNNGATLHSVVEAGGDSLVSLCFNGRSFVGNTPTIVAQAGQSILWYVFNLDLASWHNFHPHGQRWQFAHETIDTRSLGPAESFVIETIAPPVLLLPPEIQACQDPDHRSDRAQLYCLRGDFLFHCNIWKDVSAGLTGLVRSMQSVWLTPEEADMFRAATGLALDPGDNSCPPVDFDRCANAITGTWEELPNLPQITFMHAVLLPKTTRVLFWGYGPQADQSRVWDQTTGVYSQPTNQPANIAADENIWSGSHAFLNDAAGTILALGGYRFNLNPPLTNDTERRAFLFDPPSLTWSHASELNTGRFYPTTITLGDGRPLVLFGQNNAGGGATAASLEVFTPGGAGSWSAPKALPFNYFYYPWTFLLPNGDLFVAGPQKPARRFDWTATPVVDDPAKQFNQVFPQRGVNMDGTAVLLPLRPPNYAPRVLILGGNAPTTAQTAEWIDLSAPAPAWQALPNLNVARDKVNSVLLPDGRVFIAGGIENLADGGPVEIFDPEDPAAGFQAGPSMKFRRAYHSAALLLADGSVLMGGDPNGGATPNERFLPPYFFKARPTITSAPAVIGYGANFTVKSPQAGGVDVVLIRQGAVTHAFNQSQRYIFCKLVSAAGNSVQATAPSNHNVAPPGYYLLFVVDADRVPSTGVWINLS
jgi:plastocyanin